MATTNPTVETPVADDEGNFADFYSPELMSTEQAEEVLQKAGYTIETEEQRDERLLVQQAQYTLLYQKGLVSFPPAPSNVKE